MIKCKGISESWTLRINNMQEPQKGTAPLTAALLLLLTLLVTAVLWGLEKVKEMLP